MNGLSHATAQPELAEGCLIYRLCDLIDVTAALDERRRNRHELVEELVTVAQQVAAAAGPVLDNETALITALREAAADRPSGPESCTDCQSSEDGLCCHHASSPSYAKVFHDLGRALSGPGYSAETGPGSPRTVG